MKTHSKKAAAVKPTVGVTPTKPAPRKRVSTSKAYQVMAGGVTEQQVRSIVQSVMAGHASEVGSASSEAFEPKMKKGDELKKVARDVTGCVGESFGSVFEAMDGLHADLQALETRLRPVCTDSDVVCAGYSAGEFDVAASPAEQKLYEMEEQIIRMRNLVSSIHGGLRL